MENTSNSSLSQSLPIPVLDTHLKFNNFSKLPFEIIFHPQCQTWHKSNIKKVLTAFNINFKTFDSDLTSTFK